MHTLQKRVKCQISYKEAKHNLAALLKLEQI